MTALVGDMRFAAPEPFQTSEVAGAEGLTVTKLASGGFVAAWRVGNALYAQMFDRNGAAVGGNFLLPSSTATTHSDVALAPLADGGFVATWQRFVAGLGYTVEIRLFDSAGTPLGPETPVNGARGDQPSTAALAGGGFVVVYTGDDGSDTGIKAQRFDAQGAKVGGELSVNTGTTASQYYPLASTLPGGGFVTSWLSFDGIKGQVFDGAGLKVGGQIDLAPSGIWAPNLTTLASGNFIVTYVAGDDLMARIFDSTGALAVPDFAVATSTSGTQYMSSVAALPSGEFVVTWRDATGQVNYFQDGEVRGQLFSSGGVKLGEEFLVNTVTASGQTEPVSTAFGSGDVATLWVDYGSGSSTPKVEARLLFSATVGDAGNNFLQGTADRDFIFGQEGADLLRGLAGDDELDGGGGIDTLFGGADDDIVRGGDGADSIRGDEGDDQLFGDSGNDNLRGGAGVDSFDGGSGGEAVDEFGVYGDKVSFYEQTATQGAVADLRTGIISNDGFGNSETMVNIESLGSGTAFVDTFYGNDDVNSLLGNFGDFLYGFGGDDFFSLSGATALSDGGAGRDTLILEHDSAPLVPDSDGDGLAEPLEAMTTGWQADLTSGQIRDGHGVTGTVQGFENVRGSEIGDDIRGNSGDNAIDGRGGNDLLRLEGGGDDTANGGAGNDILYFGSAFTGGDIADGGDGRDVLVLQGNYTLTLSATNIANLESISLQSGARTTWGDTANNFYDYSITMVDANVTAGQQLIVNGQSLRSGEDFTFDGSAESGDGKFLVYGGNGVDHFTGGAGNDVFFFEGDRWGPSDTVNGGAGRDALIISSGTGLSHIEFGATSLTSIESISVNARFATDPSARPSYELVLNNGNVAPGAVLILNASSLTDPIQTVLFDGSAVHDGQLILFGGAGSDVLIGSDGPDRFEGRLGGDRLTGGAGADTFRYTSVADSDSAAPDQILDFASGSDKIDLGAIDADGFTGGDQAFHWIGSEAFSAQGSASAGELRAWLFDGSWYVEGDTNGDGFADLVIQVMMPAAPVVESDFLL